jgi:hypothetical protein
MLMLGLAPDHVRWRLSEESQDNGNRAIYNEFDEFQNGRYLSAGEAVWRILGYHITSIRPAVTALPVHSPTSRRHHQYHRRGGVHSTLSALDRYFLRPHGNYMWEGECFAFGDLTYPEYYTYFYHVPASRQQPPHSYLTQDPGVGEVRMWSVLRTRGMAHITRMRAVRPTHGESFHIRHLLDLYPVRSWTELRTIDGVQYDTFQDAAIAAGIFASDNEAELAMREAISNLATPHQLRILFVHMLVNECCDAPKSIWDLFSQPMSEDYFYWDESIGHTGAEEGALRELATYLGEYGRSLTDFGLPQPEIVSREVAHELERWCHDKESLADLANESYDKMNMGQRSIFDAIKKALDLDRPMAVFVSGSAGRGKTFLVNALCSLVRSRGHIALPTATAACAATLYPGGRTTHSAFKVCIFRVISSITNEASNTICTSRYLLTTGMSS